MVVNLYSFFCVCPSFCLMIHVHCLETDKYLNCQSTVHSQQVHGSARFGSAIRGDMLRVAAADDDCDEVQLGEMIDAMADALMEVQVQPTIINVPDLKPTLPPRTKKPPKGVFYKDSIRFAPKAPLPVLRQRCTCRYLCHGGRAEIKCLSCALYEPSGVSYYCRMCFDARHPWHRVAHVFTTIYQDELIGINMKLQREAIETDRYLQEGHLLKEKVAKNLAAIELVADDVAAENNMRVIGRKIAGIEGRLRDMRSGFRHGLAAEGAPLRFTDEDGIALLQRVYRGFRIRRVISLLYAERVVRVWDAAVGRGTSVVDIRKLRCRMTLKCYVMQTSTMTARRSLHLGRRQ